MKRKYMIPIFYMIVIILLFVLGRFRWDIVNRENYISGTVTTLILICAYMGMTVFAIVYAITGITHKSWQAGLPLLMSILVCVHFLWFVFTPCYSSIEHKINLDVRNEVVNMVNSGEIEAYRINVDQYMPPQRMASYDGTIRVIADEDKEYIIFTSFIGFKKNLMVVYSESNIEGIGKFIYGENVYIRKLNDNWHSVIINY